jgi:acetoin utilization deacetylase AcuC-like enzyme
MRLTMSGPPIACTLVPSPEHDLASHPENHARFQHFEPLLTARFGDRSLRLDPPDAPSVSDLVAVHPEAYLQALERAVAQGPAYIDHAPTYVTPASYRSALRAAAATLSVTEAVVEGSARCGFALVRPPGHHATATRAMGFCLLNNIALAARRAQALGARRVMIVDYDVHHGNGTQDVTESDPDILYVSTHQEGIYPGSGALPDTGRGAGEGSVVNLPLPAGAGDQGFLEIAERVLSPLSERFRPDILLVSAGYDAHWRDPLAGLQLTVAGYYHLAGALLGIAKRHCDGQAVFVLEGGYDPVALVHGVLAVFAAMADDPCPDDPLGTPPHPEVPVRRVVDNARSVHGIR